jgi:DNA-binding response OmpR family regulator
MPSNLALIIDDDPAVAEAYSETLRHIGFETEILPGGRRAMERLASAAPALVLLDLNLPQVSGEAILRHIRADARLDNTRVVVTTGEAHRAAPVRALADLVLVKPVSYDQLADLVLRLRGDSAKGSSGQP